jgi:phosphopantothenoylcysteine decarboxylase/phosphopantothenate--cysteine ligase
MQKKILLGITGGIAAYRACDIASQFIRESVEVHAIMTEAAQKIIPPLALRTITNNHIYSDMFDYDMTRPVHIELTEWADILLIAPATANIIAKIAHGICDDLLSTTVCAYRGQIIIAPAMNTKMWENPIVQDNLNILKDKLHVEVIEPVEGRLACNTIGKGKLAPVDDIVSRCMEILKCQKPKES